MPLPPTHRALVLHRTTTPLPAGLAVDPHHPTPTPTPGSAVIRVLAAAVVPYARDVYGGARKYPYPEPMVPGLSAVGRVVAVGGDATFFRGPVEQSEAKGGELGKGLEEKGQLVFFDSFIRGRDDPAGARMLSGLHEGFTPGSRKLMRGEWREGTYAEYARVPLENLYALDEGRLLSPPSPTNSSSLGLSVDDLVYMSVLLVPFGGLRDVGLKVGEKVVLAPATGTFGGAAVQVALSMGARSVVAMGRDEGKLAALKKHYNDSRVHTVLITGDASADAETLKAVDGSGPADVYYDISPPMAAGSSHLRSGILALRGGGRGRASLMGGQTEDVPIPHSAVMHGNVQLRGKWMYEREDVEVMVKMVEGGLLKLGGGGERGGVRLAGKFGLAEWESAFDCAAENSGPGVQTVIAP